MLRRARLVPDAGDTTYLSVVDREGNMVSLIESNYAEFGSGLVADGTGFVLHDRGALFNLDPASPNALAGHKRPLHTIIPAFMQKDQIRIAFGIMGGWNQAQAHAQFVSHVVDFNQNIQAALETARFTKLYISPDATWSWKIAFPAMCVRNSKPKATSSPCTMASRTRSAAAKP